MAPVVDWSMITDGVDEAPMRAHMTLWLSNSARERVSFVRKWTRAPFSYFKLKTNKAKKVTVDGFSTAVCFAPRCLLHTGVGHSFVLIFVKDYA